jgi:hypothetical protein
MSTYVYMAPDFLRAEIDQLAFARSRVSSPP